MISQIVHTAKPCGFFGGEMSMLLAVVAPTTFQKTLRCIFGKCHSRWSTLQQTRRSVHHRVYKRVCGEKTLRCISMSLAVVDATGVINFIYIVCVVIDIFYWIFLLIDVRINRGGNCLSLVFRGGFYET